MWQLDKDVVEGMSAADREKLEEAKELALSCAKDVIDFWPKFSFRTIRIMAAKMENLKQALDMLR